MPDTSKRAVLQRRISEFLGHGQVKSSGGYAPVAPDDVKQIAQVVTALLEAKYQRDPDGDLPINFQLVNRHEGRFSGFVPLPHDRHDNPEAVAKHVRAVMDNVATAAQDLDLVRRLGYLDPKPVTRAQTLPCVACTQPEHARVVEYTTGGKSDRAPPSKWVFTGIRENIGGFKRCNGLVHTCETPPACAAGCPVHVHDTKGRTVRGG